jgi:hypothetical protein
MHIKIGSGLVARMGRFCMKTCHALASFNNEILNFNVRLVFRFVHASNESSGPSTMKLLHICNSKFHFVAQINVRYSLCPHIIVIGYSLFLIFLCRQDSCIRIIDFCLLGPTNFS